MFETVGIVAKRESEAVASTLKQLVELVAASGREAILDEEAKAVFRDWDGKVQKLPALGLSCDLVIVVGGDGTFLGAARGLAGQSVPLLGVNLGRLGFLTDILPSELERQLGDVFDGRFREEDRFLLHVEVYRDEHKHCELDALNEAVVQCRP